MDFSEYKKLVGQLKVGKNLPDAIYLHESAMAAVPHDLHAYLFRTIEKLELASAPWNIVKFFKKDFKFSLLHYPSFFENSYPALHMAHTIDLGKGAVRSSSYEKSENPPILHRKETFLEPNHPSVALFSKITQEGEKAGLYENTRMIGFKKTWEFLIAKKGYTLVVGRLHKNNDQTLTNIPSAHSQEIARHRTAIDRNSLSAPMQTLFRHKFLEGNYTVFDYGCGKGDDVRILNEHGIEASGWDPIYYPNEKKAHADIINLGFVVNVIENLKERNQVIQDAYVHAEKVLVVSAMLGGENIINRHKQYGDGVITSRKTFQKYFTQKELGNYIEDVIDESAIAVAPGIFYVFKDKLEEQKFLVERQLVRRTWERLAYTKDPERFKIKQLAIFERHKDLFNEFWDQCLDLGRIPANTEFNRSEEIKALCSSHVKATQVLFEAYGKEQLKLAAEARRNDLLVYFALGMFSRRRPYKYMPETIQRDIKEFFGLYTKALEEAKELLFSVGNPVNLNEACEQAHESLKVGWLIESHSYTIHTSFINDLPPILRVYIGCATQLYGDTDDVDLIKIHVRSGKVSLMRYDDFNKKPLPLLMERIKIKLRKLDVDFFDYGEKFPPQPLYLKSNYIPEDFKNYKKQLSFDKKLQSFDWLDLSDFGPTFYEFSENLKKENLGIKGFRFYNTSNSTN